MSKKAKTSKWRAELTRLISYSITGGAWFWSGYLMFAVADQYLGLSLWWAKLLANITGITVNFILERTWVFKENRRHKRLTVVTERYFFLTLANFVIDYLIIRFLKDYFGVSPYIGQFVSAGFFYGWNYLWFKYWVFGGAQKVQGSHA